MNTFTGSRSVISELPFSTEPDGHNGQDGRGPEAGPGGDFSPLLRLDEPKGDPWAANDQHQRDVNLKGSVYTSGLKLRFSMR